MRIIFLYSLRPARFGNEFRVLVYDYELDYQFKKPLTVNLQFRNVTHLTNYKRKICQINAQVQ